MAKTYYVIRRGNEFLTNHGMRFSWMASTKAGMAPGVAYTETTQDAASRMAALHGGDVIQVLYVDGFLVLQA